MKADKPQRSQQMQMNKMIRQEQEYKYKTDKAVKSEGGKQQDWLTDETQVWTETGQEKQEKHNRWEVSETLLLPSSICSEANTSRT